VQARTKIGHAPRPVPMAAEEAISVRSAAVRPPLPRAAGDGPAAMPAGPPPRTTDVILAVERNLAAQVSFRWFWKDKSGSG